MKTIQELESEVWKNIELATRDRDPERLTYFNAIATRVKKVKELIEGIESDVFLKKETNHIPETFLESDSYNTYQLPPNGTECRFVYRGTGYEGIIKNGLLEVTSHGNFRSFSGASVRITKTNRNGWKDWELRIPGSSKWITAYSWRRMVLSKENH
jgi:hypothetical protein